MGLHMGCSNILRLISEEFSWSQGLKGNFCMFWGDKVVNFLPSLAFYIFRKAVTSDSYYDSKYLPQICDLTPILTQASN